MVWGAISSTDILNLSAFRAIWQDTDIATRFWHLFVVPFFNANRNATLFQQDNARCHTARVSMRYLDEQHVMVLPWPAFSPDLSPIEHLWDVLDRRVRRCDPQNADQLEEFYVRSVRRSLCTKFITLFGACANAAPLSLTQTEGTHGIERLANFFNDPNVISDVNSLHSF